eukprot:6455030-Prymnesium_polylepis.1
MLCRDRTSRVELASAHYTVLVRRGKRPTRCLHTWQSVQTWCTAGARVDRRAESQLLSRRESALVSR